MSWKYLKDRQVPMARWLARTPLHGVLRRAHRKLERYMDLAENWNNGDEATNGEAFLVQRIASRLETVLDIGANVGAWSARLLACNPRCQVHAFEPSPSTFGTLRERFHGNGRIHLHQAGVGRAPGVLGFHDYGVNSVLSSFVSRERSIGLKAGGIREVPVTTVDAFVAAEGLARLDLVKVDTEGYEMAVLQGMVACLARRAVRLVQFEYGGTWLDAQESLANANRLLQEHGYGLYRLLPFGLEPVHYDCRRHECFKYANFLAAASASLLEEWGVPVCPPRD